MVICMDEKRVKAFEDMLKSILSQYDSTVEKMTKLKAEGKEKIVTYRQLFANKLQLQAITIFKTEKLLISSLIQCLLKQKMEENNENY